MDKDQKISRLESEVERLNRQLTLQKQAEKLRFEHALSEERVETMRLLAASIAHELRTPLGSIRMEAQSLSEILPGLLEGYELALAHELISHKIPHQRLKNLDAVVRGIRDETVYSNSIINMLLTNIQEPKINPSDCLVLSMQACIRSALSRYPFVSEAQAALIHVDTNIDFEFQGVELLIEHLLFNLIKNALYYIESSDKGEIYLWLEASETENRLYFKDTGKGIASALIEKIFDRFAGTRHHGTGIGLAFCREVMREHGGDIECESIPGEYSLFTLKFSGLKYLE
jgi:signal transduction histidine kinase